MREIFFLIITIVGFLILYNNQDNNKIQKLLRINDKRDLENRQIKSNKLKEREFKLKNDEINEYRKYDKAIFVVGNPGL
jgi:hypothetical protein